MRVPVSWACEVTPVGGQSWRVYATLDTKQKGSLLAEVPIKDRSTEVELGEGQYRIRALVLSQNGREEPWETAAYTDLTVTGAENPPPEVAEPAVSQVEPTSVAVSADAPSVSDEEHRTQVVEMPEGETNPVLGIVVGEFERTPAGDGGVNGVRQASAPIPVDGAGGDVPATRNLAVRNVNAYGAAGAATAIAVASPERDGFGRVAIASCLAGVLTGFITPDATKPWEVDATDGIRLRTTPSVDDMDTVDWGTLDEWGEGSLTTAGGLQRWIAEYCDTALVTLDAEVDLGASTTFLLECYAQVTRRGSPWGLADLSLDDLDDEVIDPLEELDGEERATALDGPMSLWRECTLDGDPWRPLGQDAVRWQVAVSDSAGASSWQPFHPGMILTGRYVNVRLFLREPFGVFQLALPKVSVTARPMMIRTESSAAPTHAAPPGSTHTDKSAGVVYVKETGYSTSGWSAIGSKILESSGPTVLPVGAIAAGQSLESDGSSVKGRPRAVMVAKAASTANETISSASATIDGVTPTSGVSVILLKDQSTPSQNGLYIWNGAGNPYTRVPSLPSGAPIPQDLAVNVPNGSANEKTFWATGSTVGTIGTNSWLFYKVGPVVASIPAGTISWWAGPASSIPAAALRCDGSSLDRTAYAALFAAIGTTWGAVDGTHFNLPSLVQQFVRAAKADDSDVGGTGGADTHNHGSPTGSNTTGITAAISNNVTRGTAAPTAGSVAAGATITITDPGHTHSIGTDSNVPAYVVLIPIIWT